MAIRYPRGGEGVWQEAALPGEDLVIRPGKDITLVSYGTLINQVLEAARLLSQSGVEAEVVKLGRITPLDCRTVAQSVKHTGRLLVAEECAAPGCVGSRLATGLMEQGIPVKAFALQNTGRQFVTHGTLSQLRRLCGLDGESLYHKAMEVCADGKKEIGYPAV